MTKRLLIIPARLNSKRIKKKNIKFFFGEPMIIRSIKIALKSKLFTKIHISTESKKIQKIVSEYLPIDFLRPENLAKDKVSLMSVYNFVVNKYKMKNEIFNEIWFLMPCSPLISSSDLIDASKKFLLSKSKALLAVCKHSPPIQWSFKIKKDRLIPLFKNDLNKPEKKLQTMYYDTGTFGAFKSRIFEKNKSFFFQPYLLNKKKVIDIDTSDDWYIAKKLFKNIN